MLYGPFRSSGSRELEGPCCSAAVSWSWRAMVAYLMAVVSSIPKTAARCRGSAPQVRASSSCRSTRSRSRVAVRPRHDPVSQFWLTARVVMAVCWLMIRCGLAVPGQRRPRWASQARSRLLVRSSSGRARPAMTSRRPPRSVSPRWSSRMVLGRAAWTAASATARRAAGVTAAAVAWSISPGCSGWMRIRGRWPSRTPRVGSRKIVPVFLAWPNSERKAVRVCRRRLGEGARWRRGRRRR